MTSLFARSLAGNGESALQLLGAAVADCPDPLWETDLWPEQAPTCAAPHGGLVGSAPWFLAYHALTCLDHDLTGGFEPWNPPSPFDENTWALPDRVFDKTEVLGYVDWCQGRLRDTADALTDELAQRILPSPHRYAGTPFAQMLGSVPLHVVEHAAQIRQFLTGSGVRVRPMPGDQSYRG